MKQNNDFGKIFLSASLFAVGASALTFALFNEHDNIDNINNDSTVDKEILTKINNSINQRDIKEAIFNTFNLFAISLSEKDKDIMEKYFPNIMLAASTSDDFSGTTTVPGESACYSNCYWACYAASCNSACYSCEPTSPKYNSSYCIAPNKDDF